MFKAILVGADFGNDYMIDYYMEELKNLAEAKDLEVVEIITQAIDKITPNYYIGKGKVEEIKMYVDSLDADMVIFNNELSGSQIRNLEKVLDCRVIDRTLLILDIFASRAKTKAAMLQVEIAQLDYMLPRLVGLRDSLNRQQGGIGSRGPGEKKLELDRRRIERERSKLLKELDEVVKIRHMQRKKRLESNIKKIAIVGYTNAGKSTLLNELVKFSNNETDKQVFVKNMLFATLETSTRLITLDNNKSFLATDTVGFVSNLPHKLVESFKSTLEEITESDYIIHVVDSSNKFYEKQIEVTNQTLAEIGVHDIPTLYIYNKLDLTTNGVDPVNFPNIKVSLFNNEDIKKIVDFIEEKIFADYEKVKLLIPFEKGDLVNFLNENNHILSQSYANEGTIIELMVSSIQKGKYADYII